MSQLAAILSRFDDPLAEEVRVAVALAAADGWRCGGVRTGRTGRVKLPWRLEIHLWRGCIGGLESEVHVWRLQTLPLALREEES